MSHRVCNADDCDTRIDRLRANARYCSSACRARASETRALAGTTPGPFWDGMRAQRRQYRSEKRAAPLTT